MIFKRKRVYQYLIYFSLSFGQIFLDVTDISGVGYVLSEESFLGAGATIVDIDDDGYLDILIPTFTEEPIKIMHNNGDLTFTDITSSTGIVDIDESKNILVADYDNDGDDDMFIVNYFAPSILYNNDGYGFFTDVTASSGLSSIPYSSRVATWLDINNDGFLDLYVLNRELTENNILYLNNGDATFTDITESADVLAPFEAGLVVAALDYNNDGLIDIYVGNDKGTGNILYHNNGDNTFTDASISSNALLYFDTMGLAVADYDGNGYLDIYATNLDDGNALLKNNGDGTFTNVAADLGIEVNKVCWGTVFVDYDNDGWVDLQVSTGCDLGLGVCNPDWPGYNPGIDNKDMLYKNQGNGSFINVSESSGLDENYLNYGTTMGDVDNDGYVDLYIFSEGITSRLYKNMDSFSSTNNWVKLKFIGTVSNRNGIGARVNIIADGHTQIQEVRCGSSYSAQNSLILHFGIGTSEIIDTIKVQWPSGITDEFYNYFPNQLVEIIEGMGYNHLGDLNFDGSVDVSDIIIIIMIIIDSVSPTDYQIFTADYNSDLSIDIFDIIIIIDFIIQN